MIQLPYHWELDKAVTNDVDQPDLQSKQDISTCGQSEEILHACCKSSRVKLVKVKDVPAGNVAILAINANSTNTLVQYCGVTQRKRHLSTAE